MFEAWPGMIERLGGLSPVSLLYSSALSHLEGATEEWLAVNLVSGLILLALSRGRIPLRLGLYGFLALIGLDLYLANVRTMPEGTPQIFDFPPIAARAMSPDGRPRLGEFRVFRQNMEFRDTNPALAGYPRLLRMCIWHRNSLERNLDTMEGFEDIVGYNALPLTEGLAMLSRHLTPGRLLLYNVRYIIGPANQKPLQSVRSDLFFADPKNDLLILRLPEALPRAYWVPAAVAAKDEAEADRLLDTVDSKKTVVLTTDEKPALTPAFDLTMLPAKIVRYEPDRVVVESRASAAGWLVLSDRYYPGWQARVDGRPAAILKANVMVRAVRLEAGTHTVEFSFHSRPLFLGALISIPAWIIVLAWGTVAAARSRRKGPGLDPTP
jgi:hypothetical protein